MQRVFSGAFIKGNSIRGTMAWAYPLSNRFARSPRSFPITSSWTTGMSLPSPGKELFTPCIVIQDMTILIDEPQIQGIASDADICKAGNALGEFCFGDPAGRTDP